MTLGLLVTVASAFSTLRCLDENDNPVDWWMIYKMPNGFNYAYKDSNDRSTTLVPFTDRTLDRLDGALGSTLHQIYVQKSTLGYVLYNDEPPAAKSLLRQLFSATTKFLLKESTSGAHAKGVLATDGSEGFWLVHSVPKFPDLGPAEFTWTADDTYGQSFLCMSLDAKNVRAASTQLQYIHPTIFESNIPSAIAKKIPELSELISGSRVEGTNSAEIKSIGGQTFTSFAKDHDWGQDLFEDFVAPTLKCGFKVETWRRGGVLPSICADDSTYDVINVLSMKFGPLEFTYTHDHAKVAVSTQPTNPFVCVGDINQMESQRKRGGGTVCFKHVSMWKALSSSVAEVEKCGDADAK